MAHGRCRQEDQGRQDDVVAVGVVQQVPGVFRQSPREPGGEVLAVPVGRKDILDDLCVLESLSALAQRRTIGWPSVSLNDSVNETARSTVARGGPEARIASYILRTRSVTVPWTTFFPLSIACSCADNTAAVSALMCGSP
jgi:hypothetical protein